MLRLVMGIEIEAVVEKDTLTNYRIPIGSYHSGNPLNAFWETQHDSSINSSDNYMGVEFVSTPIWNRKQLQQAIDSLFISLGFFELEDDNSIDSTIKFDDTTGCHLHFSVIDDKFLMKGRRKGRNNKYESYLNKHKKWELKSAVLKKYDRIKKRYKDDRIDDEEYKRVRYYNYDGNRSGDDFLASQVTLVDEQMMEVYSFHNVLNSLEETLADSSIFYIEQEYYNQPRNEMEEMIDITDNPYVTMETLEEIEKTYKKQLNMLDEKQCKLFLDNLSRRRYSLPIDWRHSDNSTIRMNIRDRNHAWYIYGLPATPYRNSSIEDLEISSGKGLEWRAFNLIGATTIGDVRKRLSLAYDVVDSILRRKDGNLINQCTRYIDFMKVLNLPKYSEYELNINLGKCTYPKRKRRYRKYKIPIRNIEKEENEIHLIEDLDTDIKSILEGKTGKYAEALSDIRNVIERFKQGENNMNIETDCVIEVDLDKKLEEENNYDGLPF